MSHMDRQRRRPPQSYANLGKAWETSISLTLRSYHKRGIGWGGKTPERVIRNRRRSANESDDQATYTRAHGLPDFVATVCGIPCAFDAKEVTTGSLKTSRVPDHQLQWLLNWASAPRSVAFLLLWLGHGKPALVVDVRWWEREIVGRKSVNVDRMLEEAGGPVGARGVIAIWPGQGVPVPFADAVVELCPELRARQCSTVPDEVDHAMGAGGLR